MAKMSQTFKEILQIVVFLLVVGILALTLIIYPLNRTKAFLARPDSADFNPDTLPPNDISGLAELRAVVDTFRVDADGLTSLACVYLAPVSDSNAALSPKGTAILLHGDGQDRNAMLPLSQALLDSGFAVCLYDQRASGRSTGRYYSDGEYEAADLSEVIAFLRIRDRAASPFVIVGQRVGADAALLEATADQPPDGVVAVSPYITTDRWLNILMDEHDMYWIPFSHTVFMFWYELRSGYAPEGRHLENLRPPKCPTLILASAAQLSDETMTAYTQLAKADRIITETLPPDADKLNERILAFVSSLAHSH
ncbi:MAG: alpha/beta hydrolase [candidate division Zixibacteria bacterium]|nr:alpha/beta hydrolase [candidate division Zixibacteria bacterium]